MSTPPQRPRTAALCHVVTTLITLGVLPVKLAHEATHALVAAPWAEEWAIVITSRGAECHVEWRGDPGWGRIAAHYAPFALGTVVAAVVLVWVAFNGVVLPEELHEQLQLAVAAMAWGLYTAPSIRDNPNGGTDE